MSSQKKLQCPSQRKHPLLYHCRKCGTKLKERDRKYKIGHLRYCLKCYVKTGDIAKKSRKSRKKKRKQQKATLERKMLMTAVEFGLRCKK